MREQTLAIIKPDVVQAGVTGSIIQKIEDEGFKIVAMRLAKLDARRAEGFYYVHKNKPFFSSLISFMTSGPCILLALEGVDVIQKWRTLMGSTDPFEAAQGTVRRLYGTSIEQNAVHGSDSREAAIYELTYFFKGTDFVNI
jgi:nucleoside-diphosphate kinase